MQFDLASILKQFSGASPVDAQAAEQHFESAAENAHPELLSDGLSAMFKSAQTPPFGQMVSQLFGNANADQQSAMLNQILASLSPQALNNLLNRDGPLRSALGNVKAPDAYTPISVAASDVVSIAPAQVEQITNHAEQNNPGVVDQLSAFYAQHASLVKTLGGAALAIALAKMSQAQKASR
jgi:hypothetical protein